MQANPFDHTPAQHTLDNKMDSLFSWIAMFLGNVAPPEDLDKAFTEVTATPRSAVNLAKWDGSPCSTVMVYGHQGNISVMFCKHGIQVCATVS